MNADPINTIEVLKQKSSVSNFPWPQLPTGLSDIIFDWQDNLGYQAMYTLPAMLAAASAALGNRVKLQITSQWSVAAPLWVMTVGKPGTGKSSPMRTVFGPLSLYDSQLRNVYRREVVEWTKNGKKSVPPTLHQVMLSDFTPESLWKEHGNNPSGVVVAVDELKGMLDSVDRYNNSPLVSQLLTAYTGGSIKITRKSEELPTLVEDACVGIYGTIQPEILYEAMSKDLITNGFYDRWLIMWPDYQGCRLLSTDSMTYSGKDTEEESAEVPSITDWNTSLAMMLKWGHQSGDTTTLMMTKDAAEFYAKAQNEVTSIEADQEGLPEDFATANRRFKMGVTVAKMALTFEALTCALLRRPLQEVTKRSVIGAVDVYNWFEQRTRILLSQCPANKNRVSRGESDQDDLIHMLSLVALDFTRTEALEAATAQMKVSRASIDRMLKLGKESGLIESVGHGKYHKTDKYINLMMDSYI